MYKQKKHVTKLEQLKTGDIIAVTHYLKVKRVIPQNYSAGRGEARVVADDLDNDDLELNVDGKRLVEAAASADQHHETVQASQTQLAEILISSTNRPFTAVFTKTDGTERKLRGRLIRSEPLMGRSMVEDLDITDKKMRVRLIDHRTLKTLIVDGVRYESKAGK